jgi:hypothetical protein
MDKLLERAAVLADAVVTYLLAAAVGISAAAEEITAAAPEGWDTATAWALRVVAWIAASVAVVRRVTPVAAEQRGLLPPSKPL